MASAVSIVFIVAQGSRGWSSLLAGGEDWVHGLCSCLLVWLARTQVHVSMSGNEQAWLGTPVHGTDQEASLGHFTSGCYQSSLLHPLGLSGPGTKVFQLG